MLQSLSNELEQLYRDCRGQLFTCALAITRCADRAEDAVQDAFYRLFRMNQAPRSLKAYAFRAVRNAAIDQLRRNPVAVEEVTEFIFDRAAGPRELAAGREFSRHVEDAMLALSDDERETVVQHLYGDLTFREIAELREAPLGTITSWYQRAIQKLRARLEA